MSLGIIRIQSIYNMHILSSSSVKLIFFVDVVLGRRSVISDKVQPEKPAIPGEIL